jgi:hypothetical protein
MVGAYWRLNGGGKQGKYFAAGRAGAERKSSAGPADSLQTPVDEASARFARGFRRKAGAAGLLPRRTLNRKVAAGPKAR